MQIESVAVSGEISPQEEGRLLGVLLFTIGFIVGAAFGILAVSLVTISRRDCDSHQEE